MGIHDWAKSLLGLTTQELDDTLFVMSDEDWICEEYKTLLRTGGFRPYRMTLEGFNFATNLRLTSAISPYPWSIVLLTGMFHTVGKFLADKENNGKCLWFWVSSDIGEVFLKHKCTTFSWNSPDENRLKASQQVMKDLYARHSLPREVIDRFWRVNPHPYIVENKIVPNVMGPFADELSAWTALLCAINNEEMEKSNDKLRDQGDAETGTTVETPPETLAEDLYPIDGW